MACVGSRLVYFEVDTNVKDHLSCCVLKQTSVIYFYYFNLEGLFKSLFLIKINVYLCSISFYLLT